MAARMPAHPAPTTRTSKEGSITSDGTASPGSGARASGRACQAEVTATENGLGRLPRVTRSTTDRCPQTVVVIVRVVLVKRGPAREHGAAVRGQERHIVSRPGRHRELDRDVAVERRCERAQPLPLPGLRERPAEPAGRRGRPGVHDVLAGRGKHCFVGEVAADDDRPGVTGEPRGALGEDAVDLGPRLGRILRVVAALVARVGRAGRHMAADVGDGGPALGAPVERGPRRVEPACRHMMAVLVSRHFFGRDSVQHLVGDGDLARAVTPEGVRVARRRQLGRSDDRDRDGRELGAVRHGREELGPAAPTVTAVREDVGDTNRDAGPFVVDVGAADECRVGGSPRRCLWRPRPIPAG